MSLLKSALKVNLGLRILDRRPDGYHNIATVFQELDFHDTVAIEPAAAGCTVSADVDWVPTSADNSCRRVYEVLRRRFPDLPGVTIHLEKRIPAGAGLGGGSANGATVLTGLNALFGLGLSADELERLAAEVGADVPFFIRGGTQVGEGIGDRLTPLAGPAPGWYLLLIPDLRIATAWAYGAVKKVLQAKRPRINFRSLFQGRNSPWELFENDFERIVIPAYPEIGRLKHRLSAVGAYFASLSGSGSTVFGIFDDEASARAAESEFKNSCKTILARPFLR